MLIGRPDQQATKTLGALPTFGEFILMFPALALLFHPLGLSILLNDGDTGWHIKTGEWILRNHAIPRADLFSFTKPGEPWIAWEWLWDAVMAAVHSVWGLGGVALISLGILSAVYYRLYNKSVSTCLNPVIALCATALAMTVSWGHWLARPHLITLAFILIALWAIEEYEGGRMRSLLILPPLTALWANVHGGFMMIFPLLGAYCGGAMIKAVVAAPERKPREAIRFGIYASAILVCGLASLLNPYGIRLHEHILSYLQDPLIRQRTIEFQPPNLASPHLLLLFGLDFLAASWYLLQRRYGEGMVIAGTAWMALSSVRHVSVHAVVVTPLLCESLSEMARAGARHIQIRRIRDVLAGLEENGREWLQVRRTPLSFAAPALLALTIVLGATLRLAPRISPEFRNEVYPVQAVASIQESSGLRVFSDDAPGYVIYALFPRGRIFCDGRMDFYGSSMISLYDQIRFAEPGWQAAIEHYGVNTVILRKETGLVTALNDAKNWKETFEDGRYVVFRKQTERKMATEEMGREDRSLIR